MNFGLYRGCIEAGQYFFDLISPKNCFNKYWAWFLSHEIIWVPKINNFHNLKISLHHPVYDRALYFDMYQGRLKVQIFGGAITNGP